MDHRSDVNLVHHYAGELRRIGSGAPPSRILNKGTRCKLEDPHLPHFLEHIYL
jgi:hypothetical protein